MRKRKLTIAAIALLGVTTAAGAYAMQKPDCVPMDGKPCMERQMKRGIPGLSEESQKLMREMRKTHHAERKANRDAMKAKRAELKAIMSAEKFDKEAFLAKKAEMASEKAKTKAKHTEAFADVLAKMPAKDRAAIAEHHGKKRHGMKHHRGMKRQGMGGEKAAQ